MKQFSCKKEYESEELWLSMNNIIIKLNYFTLAEFSPTQEDGIKSFGKCYNIDIVNTIK